MRLIAASCVLAMALAWDTGLRDSPIVGESLQYLDGQWNVNGAGYSFDGSVPGDLFSDLEAAGIIEDPIFENNWLKNSSLWAQHTFNYSTTFDLSEAEASSDGTMLVFDGIKMGARIYVNGQQVGSAIDQFRRYNFSVGSQGAAVAGSNTLVVSFDPSLTVDGRFMACTGGWDWAPYSDQTQAAQPGDAHVFTKGIWKSVYVVTTTSALLTHVVPHTYYNGEYVIEPLKDGEHAGFTVDVRTHFWAPSSTSGTLAVTTTWGASTSASVTVPAGESNTTLKVDAKATDMKLWWPNGMGEQHLYNVTVTYTPASSGSASFSAVRRVGFKYFALVTGNDTSPGYIEKNKDVDGNDGFGMFFRVNGAAFYSRGANMIPMDEMEARVNSTALRVLMESAAAANFNTIRVWGGGVFQYDAFYDACDELGLVIYHDMQYAQQGHSPDQTATQEAEFRHQIRRISSHVALAIVDGCNECHVVIGTPTGIYATFVLTVVVEEDTSHVVWPSCPSPGWKAGVNRLTSLPNGSPLGLLPNAKPPAIEGVEVEYNSKIETHGPYQHGGGFPAVNGPSDLQLFDSGIPLKVSEGTTGLDQKNVYASEFGIVSPSSFESMSATLKPEHWSMHAGQPNDSCNNGFAKTCSGPNVMAQRNYPMDNILDVYWKKGDPVWLNTTGEMPFKQQLWQAMIGSALFLKANIEGRRQDNQFGTLVWQYGEIWPTGGWGSVEYAAPRPGQVLGGRWKPLQHWYEQFLYRDVLAACGTSQCFVRNDRSMQTFNGAVVVDAVSLTDNKVQTLVNQSVAMAAGPGITTFFNIDTSNVPQDAAVLRTTVLGEDGTTVASNFNLFLPPYNLTNAAKGTKITVEVADHANADKSVDVTVTSNKAALFVTLTTQATGRFSENAFLMTAGSKTVQFLPFTGEVDIDLLKKTIREEDLSTYA